VNNIENFDYKYKIMANNARIEYPDINDIPDNSYQPAGPASFDPGMIRRSPNNNMGNRTTRLREMEELRRNQPEAPASMQQFNTKKNDLFGNQSKLFITI
jgi:hypothetical protein